MSAASDATGLAAGSNSKTINKITYGEKLRRAALAAQDGNLAINPVTSAFTYAVSSSATADLTQVINAPASIAKFLSIGGAPTVNGGSLYLKSGTTLGSGNLGADTLSRQNQCAYECMVEGPAIAMQVYTGAEFLLNVAAGYTLATMAYLTPGPINVAQSNTLYIRINNPNFDGRPWRARFELGCNGAGLANFLIAPNTKLRPPRDPSPLNALVIGDSMSCTGAGGAGFSGSITSNVLTVTGFTSTATSYITPGPLNGTGVAPGQYIVAQTGGTTGGNGTYSLGISQANQSATTMRSGNAWGHQSWVSRLALMMGWRLWSASLPGTGFVQANGNFQAFKDRITADLAVVASAISPDIVIIPVSINDYNQVYGNMQPATISILTKVRAAFPGVPIIVTGMVPGSYGPNNGCISVENAVNGSTSAGIQTYLAATGDANVFSIPLTTETTNGSLIFGTGTCGTAVGDGNADSYVCVDRIHLQPGVGERFVSQSMANLLAPIIAQI
jgi:hypothetical protein